MEVVGPYALPYQPEHEDDERWNEPPIGPDWAGPVAPTYFNWRKISIYGGSNEIQRNIIAKAILGLVSERLSPCDLSQPAVERHERDAICWRTAIERWIST